MDTTDSAWMAASVRVSVPDVADRTLHCTGDVVSRMKKMRSKVTEDPSMMNTASGDDASVKAETVFMGISMSLQKVYVVD